MDFDRNLAPTWGPTWGAKGGPQIDPLELNMAENPSWAHFGPQGRPGHRKYRFFVASESQSRPHFRWVVFRRFLRYGGSDALNVREGGGVGVAPNAKRRRHP